MSWEDRVGNVLLWIYLLTPSFLALAPALGAVLWARRRLRKALRPPEGTGPTSRITGAGAAAAIVGAAGVEGVSVVAASGPLADFYDPGLREIRLSRPAFEGSSPPALAVAAHEAGHALQGRSALALRTGLVFASGLAGWAGALVIAAGFLYRFEELTFRGALLVAVSALAALALLPIERDANRRVRRAIASAGLGEAADSPAFADALVALPFAPLAGILPFGRPRVERWEAGRK